MLAYKCFQMKWWAAVTVVAVVVLSFFLFSFLGFEDPNQSLD